MKKFFYYIFRFTYLFVESMETFFRLLFFENFKDYIKQKNGSSKCTSNEIVLFANGPSQKDVLNRVSTDIFFHDKDLGFVNYLGEEDIYTKVKPKYYFLADPQFFFENHKNFPRSLLLYDRINSLTSWKMSMYVHYAYLTHFKKMNYLKNSNITIIPFHSTPIKGFKFFRNILYRNGLGDGDFRSVIQHAIYVSVHLKYKNIHLFGVDHNYFENLIVTEQNILCNKLEHYYDKSDIKFEPAAISSGNPLTTYEFLFWHAELFKYHHILNNHAKLMGTKIFNHTPNSFIDSYEKVTNKVIS